MSGAWESILVSLGVGLVVLAIGLAIKRVPNRITVLGAVGIAILAFVLWPRAVLVEVPDLAGLSRDEADLTLTAVSLTGAPQPQEAPSVQLGHVIPASQNPLPGTKVRRGTLVRYSISTGGHVPPDDSNMVGTISIFSPSETDDFVPSRGADNVFRFDVEGTIEGVDLSQSTPLLWVRPIEPPSEQPGWYLQRLPANGIRSISGNTWSGVCQIGNRQYPPQDGSVVEIAASLVPSEEAARLEARQGPVTVVVLPGVVSNAVRLTLRLR